MLIRSARFAAIIALSSGFCLGAVSSPHGQQDDRLQMQPMIWTTTPMSKARKKELTEKARELYGNAKLKITVPEITQHGGGGQRSGGGTEPSGLTARGVVIDEGKGELALDMDPCNGVIATFHDPYVIRDAGEITCKGKKFARKEVEQRSVKRAK
jgi:hypothetical protein